MTRALWIFALAVASAAGAAEPEKAAAEGASEFEGVSLRFDSAKPTFDAPEGPAFSVHAATGKQTADLGLWSLEDARAVIYRAASENLVLVSKSMTFDMENKAAQLAGGVRVTSGRMTVDVDDIAWDDGARTARSESEATLHDGANRITGRPLAIFPDDDRIELGGGTANILLAEAPQDTAPADTTQAPKETRFDSIEVKPHRGISGNIAGQIREIKGPAHLVLVGKNPDDSMNIDADLVTFTYAVAEDTMPAEMKLSGRIELVHSQGTFRADGATVDLANGKARFDGNVTVSNAQIRGAKMDFFELDLNTREFVMGPGQIERFEMRPSGDAADKKKP